MTLPSVSLRLLTLLAFFSFLSCTESEQPKGQMPEGSLEEQLTYVSDPANFSSEDERLNALFELYAESKKRNSPMMATFLGMEGYNHLWDDLSPEGRQQTIDESTAFYKAREMFNADDLDEDDQLNYALFQRDVSDSYNLYAQYPEQYLVVDQIQGINQMIPAVLQMMPQRSEDHLNDLLARLRGIPALMQNTQRLLQEGIEQGIVMPRTTVVQVPEQVRGMIADDPNKSVFYASLASINETIDLEGVDGESVQQEAQTLIEEEINPALEQFATFMAEEYVPNARASFGLKDLPNGEAWYKERIRNNTTTDLSAQEIHEIGLSEVARIREAMQQIIDEVAFSGDMQAFNEFLKTDPQFYYDMPEALLTGYREICKRIDPKLPQLFGHLPRLPYGVIEVPAYQAPATTPAYYQPGSIKHGTPGYFFANTYNLKSRPKWGMESLAIHEA
ncbi:MAG: DUF885 domain-containing protein, partial [Tunicatimonas sp.]|uniref:DUF885 domain-containing protein n=1 Tax=Tunicatimonas sp. TaxID=1940096 RepID=UPI003C781623